MALDQLLDSAVPWLGWSGLGLALLTVVAFLANWGLRFRLVGVSSFTLLLAVSCWAFGVSYTPPVVVEGAIRLRWCSTTARTLSWLRRQRISKPPRCQPPSSNWPAISAARAGQRHGDRASPGL